ncbi:MAG: hypothetical protein WC748_00885 [Legionellales bacterium]|jgi:hypothetical protein
MPTKIVEKAKNQLLTGTRGIVTQIDTFKSTNSVQLTDDAAATVASSSTNSSSVNSNTNTRSWHDSLYATLVTVDLVFVGRAFFSNILPPRKVVSNSSAPNNPTNSIPVVALQKVQPLQAFIDELEASNKDPDSPKYLINILILWEIKKLVSPLETLAFTNKTVSHAIQNATVQFVKDMQNETKTDKDAIELAYREKISESSKQLTQGQLSEEQQKAINKSLEDLMVHARKQEALLNDLILVLQGSSAPGNLPTELDNLINKIIKLSNHLDSLDNRKAATEIQKEIIQFLVTTIESLDSSGKNKMDPAKFSSAITNLNSNLQSSLELLSPKERQMICASIGAVILMIASGGIVFGVATGVVGFGAILSASMSVSGVVGGVLGGWGGYKTSSYVKITNAQNDIEQAVPAENTAFQARPNNKGG